MHNREVSVFLLGAECTRTLRQDINYYFHANSQHTTPLDDDPIRKSIVLAELKREIDIIIMINTNPHTNIRQL